MKKLLPATLLLFIAANISATNFFDQLCTFNFNWEKYRNRVTAAPDRIFSSDKEYISAHLSTVLPVLYSNPTGGLTNAQLRSRMQLLQLLDNYRLAGRFPVNNSVHQRIPVFIDGHFTHCAVAYLLQQTGHENLALRIAADDNYAWVKDIKTDGLLQWQQASGLTLEELKLIQGAYDFYNPRGYELPNKYEIPQKPSCITLYFETTKSWRKQHPGKQAIWCRGEGSNGVLHGRWEQNYTADLPWIIGFYNQGKRTGQWFEYYPGTNLLCRTEYWHNDKLNGTRTRFDREGKIIEEILFKDGNALIKTNYDRADSLKWVRVPIDSQHVATNVYALNGQLLASGKEAVYNPGNLLWFQNIELTALNSFAITARNNVQGYHPVSHSGFSKASPFSPPLVTYKKEGTWRYYNDCTPIQQHLYSKKQLQDVLYQQFRHFGPGIYLSLARFKNMEPITGYRLLHVDYKNDALQDFYGYGETDFTHLKVLYHADEPNKQPVSFFLDRYHLLQRPQPIVKAVGAYNRDQQRIGTWNHFDTESRLYKTEQYILPKKDEEIDERLTSAMRK
jgi:antitoxin component YwqK of YwqJK toxin-antitoxin module